MLNLPDDLRARLSAAAAVHYPSPRPDDDTAALAQQVRTAGRCAHISTATSRPDEEPAPWQHEVCILAPDHLGYHESVGGRHWALNRVELESRAELYRARAEELAGKLGGP